MKNPIVRNICCIFISLMMIAHYFLSVYAADVTDASAEAFVLQAASQVGCGEENDGSTKYGATFGRALLEKWDVAFVAWCAKEAGVTENVIPHYTDVTAFRSFFMLKGVYEISEAYDGSYIPKRGDIAFISDTSRQYELSGVGIVEAVEEQRIAVIEGHCPDIVKRNFYDLAGKNIIGYASPKFSNATSSTSTVLPINDESKYQPGIYRTESVMNFRVSNSTSSKIIDLIPEGTILEIDRVKDDWGHAVYNDQSGWLYLEYSTLIDDIENQYKPGTYKTDFVTNFHKTPEQTNSNILCSVPIGTVLEVTECKSTWGKTEYNGQAGWIMLEYCTYYDENEEDPIPTPPSEPETIKVDWLVVDISVFNDVDKIDWSALKKSGVEGVIMRVGGRYVISKGLYYDDAFSKHYSSAKKAGMHIGVYFFSYAMNEAQAIEEAEMTLNVLNKNNCELDMPVYIDIEDYDNDYQHENAGKTVCTKVVDSFCKTIEDAGYLAGIYCNKYFAENLIDHSVFENRALWIAHYSSVCGYTATPIGMWQYTSMGTINGYSGGYIDLNRCYINYPAIINGYADVPQPSLIPGDVNGDGQVDPADARLTLRHSVNLEAIREQYINNADMNNDGTVDAADARLILRKSVGLQD